MMAGYDESFRDEVIATFTQCEKEFPSTTAAAQYVAARFGISRDTVRRWALDGGAWEAHNSAEVRKLRAENAALKAELAVFKGQVE